MPLLCAIACREAGSYWLPLTPHETPDRYSPSPFMTPAATPNARGPPFRSTRRSRLTYGDAFTKLLIDETNNAARPRAAAAQIVYKGYASSNTTAAVRTDENFFRHKLWYNFNDAQPGRPRAEAEVRCNGRLQDAVRAYNGSVLMRNNMHAT